MCKCKFCGKTLYPPVYQIEYAVDNLEFACDDHLWQVIKELQEHFQFIISVTIWEG